MKSPELRPILPSDFEKISRLSDLAFGENYIKQKDLERQWPLMVSNGICGSFVLEAEGKILGFRVTFLPGTWLTEIEGRKCLSQNWNTDPNSVAYFKTALVDESLRGQGWGKKMAQKSLEVVKSLGGKAVVTHSWNESPGDSSGRYLRALGFKSIGKIPGFWGEAEYDCVECNNSPCTCSATEMMMEI